MKKLFLLCSMLLCCIFSHAQTLSLSAASGTHYDGDVITITVLGETNDQFVDLQDVPSPVGTPTIISPANQGYASFVYIDNLAVNSLYNPSSHAASTFKVQVHNSSGMPITAKFAIGSITYTDINHPGSTFNNTLYVTITITNGSAPPSVYYNTAISGTLYNNTCSQGYASSAYSYSISAGQYSSTISQTDANNKAFNAAQAAANANEPCNVIPNPAITSYTVGTVSYPNVPITFNFTPSPNATSSVIKAVDALGPIISTTVTGAGTSGIITLVEGHNYTISVTSYGIQYTAGLTSTSYPANIPGTAPTYYNTVLSSPLARNNCSTGYNGSTVTYIVPAGTYTSVIDQAHADAQAQADVTANAQNYANAQGTCIQYEYVKLVSSYALVAGQWEYNVSMNFYSDASGSTPVTVNNYATTYSYYNGTTTTNHAVNATGTSVIIVTKPATLDGSGNPIHPTPPPSVAGYNLVSSSFYGIIL